MRTTTFWVCLLDCWRTCSPTVRSHPELEGTESIIGQGLRFDWPAMAPPRGVRERDTFSSWLIVYILPTQWQPLCSLAGFFLQVNSWMVSSPQEGGSVGDGVLDSLSEEWAGLTFPGGGMECLGKCRKGLFLTLVTSQLVYHYLHRPQALMKAPPEAKAEGKARLRFLWVLFWF